MINTLSREVFLISSMIGIDSRTTMDMDATIKGYPVNKESIRTMIENIISISVEDNINFQLNNIGEIREGDEYTGYRVSLSANYEKMAVPLKLDITTGDIITPREIEYSYALMMEDRNIRVLAYNLSTILAEKLETVISRGDQNTRPRDYYDIYILSTVQSENIGIQSLHKALMATSEKRGSVNLLKQYCTIMNNVKQSEIMKRQWNLYRKEFSYASEIEFADTCSVVIAIMDKVLECN